MRRLRRFVVPLAYVACTVGMTWPAVRRLGERIVAQGTDAWIFWWNDWWVERALATGQDVYRTQLLFYPRGVSLAY
jgi:hypothetical protein